MPYYTIEQKSRMQQLKWEDVINGNCAWMSDSRSNTGGTITRFLNDVPEGIARQIDTAYMTNALKRFNERWQHLLKAWRPDLYHSFEIPKRTGGKRKIDQPNNELMTALRELKGLLESFGAKHHTAAFAYVKGRSCVNAVERHQRHGSQWFLKTDFSNFFGSSTPAFVYRMVEKSFPFSEIVKTEEGKTALETALGLCFLNGGLPQGTPISPMLTNLMMIPIDHRLAGGFARRDMVYTRYADDMLISADQHFNHEKTVAWIESVLKEFNAPFHIKPEKTRFGSLCGANWNLGVMLNKDHEITVGYRNKKFFKSAICHFITDHQNGMQWSGSDARELLGTLSYYSMVEKEYFSYIIRHYNEKFGVDVVRLLKQDASGDSFLV